MDENLTTEERNTIRKIFEELGELQTIKYLGVGTESILRVLADLPIRRGTTMVLREALRKKRKV